MENEDKQTISDVRTRLANVDSSATSSNSQRQEGRPHPPPERSPEYSPAKSSISSDLSSLSHGFSPEREEAARSPPADPPQNVSAKPPSPVTVANRYVRDESLAITKTDHGSQAGFFGGTVEEGSGEGGASGGRRLRPPLTVLRRSDKVVVVKKAALGFRIFEFLFCLIASSVMAADKNQGWALDSFYRYKEFRYCMSVNVIGFVYSGIQGCDLAYQFVSGNYVNTRHHLRYYFDFAVDQVLTYLLISASSSAATRVDDWQSNWGKDKFPDMASASVGLSFVAFVAFAFSSLISGYLLCTSKSM